MTASRAIATAAAVQVTTMLASAIILVAVAEGLQWFLCWKDSRK